MEAPGSPGASFHALAQTSQDPRCLTSPHLENRSIPDHTRVEPAAELGGTKVLNLLHILATPDRQAGCRPTQRWRAGQSHKVNRAVHGTPFGLNTARVHGNESTYCPRRSPIRSRDLPGRLLWTSASEVTEPFIGRPSAVVADGRKMPRGHSQTWTPHVSPGLIPSVRSR